MRWIALGLFLTPPAYAQCELQKLRPADNACEDAFGYSTRFVQDSLAVSAYLSNNNGLVNSGSVYIYEHDGGSWIECIELGASDPQFGAGFGFPLASDGSRLAVGATSADNKGAVYAFEKQGDLWTETGKMAGSTIGSGNCFACSLDIDGDTIVAGAYADHDQGLGSGSAWIFEWDGANWSETTQLLASDGAIGNTFGASVAVFGNTAIIGAIGGDASPNGNEGCVYVFEYFGGTWTEQSKLVASDATEDDRFGASVAIEGDVIVVGAPGTDLGAWLAGSVYIFERNPDLTWGPQETFKIQGGGVSQASLFGLTVEFDEGRILASSYDGEFGSPTGAVYLFDRGPTSWKQTTKLVSSDAGRSDIFGRSFALSGNTIVVGADGTDDADPDDDGCNSGSAYVFEIAPNTTQYGFGLSCPCGNDDSSRGCVNSRGLGAVLGACGTTSVTNDDLILGTSFLPLNQFGIVFMGDAQISAPFGDGRRAVGAGGLGIYRYLPVIHSGSVGTAQLGPGIVARSQSFSTDGRIDPGETWNFQLWYRDPMGSPCGARFNLTNALAATFVP